MPITLKWESTEVWRINNATAELMAIRMAAKLIEEMTKIQTEFKGKCVIKSDSEYAVKSINEWIHTWINSKEEIVKRRKNVDIIIQIKKLLMENEIELRYVRAHQSKDTYQAYGNHYADMLSNIAVTGRVDPCRIRA